MTSEDIKHQLIIIINIKTEDAIKKKALKKKICSLPKTLVSRHSNCYEVMTPPPHLNTQPLPTVPETFNDCCLLVERLRGRENKTKSNTNTFI